MNYKKFDKIVILILGVLLIIEGLLLIFNIKGFTYTIEFTLFDLVSIIFCIMMGFNVGAFISYKYLK